MKVCFLGSTSPQFPYQLGNTILFSASVSSTFLDSTQKWGHTAFTFLCVWFMSLSIASSRFIHVVILERFPSFWGCITVHSIYTYMSYFLYHSLVGRYLDCFHILAFVKNVAVNVGMNTGVSSRCWYHFWGIWWLSRLSTLSLCLSPTLPFFLSQNK